MGDYADFMRRLKAPDEPEKAPAPAGVPSGPMDEQLEDLTGLAITRIRQVLEVEPDLADEKLTKLQATAAQGVLNIQAKVDEGRLKRAKLNTLPKLIELIAEERARRAAEERAREIAETERVRQRAKEEMRRTHEETEPVRQTAIGTAMRRPLATTGARTAVRQGQGHKLFLLTQEKRE
jgi:hypothetical protein